MLFRSPPAVSVERASASVEAKARNTHYTYTSSGSRELYLSSLAAIFSGGVSSSAPKLSYNNLEARGLFVGRAENSSRCAKRQRYASYEMSL